MRPWVEAAIDLVYPRNCVFCEAALAEVERGVICSACLEKVKFIRPPFCSRCALPFAGEVQGEFVCGYCADLPFHFERAVAACRAEGVVRDCIHRFKYGRELYFGPHLAQWLIGAARERFDWREVDAIVPVPLHPRKKREREFNQAEVLAAALSGAVGVPVLDGVLRRVKDTATQTRLNAAERAANLRGAFAVRERGSLLKRRAVPARGAFRDRRLVLVDDVFTTGATLDACAKVLRHEGAARVLVVTVARGV